MRRTPLLVLSLAALTACATTAGPEAGPDAPNRVSRSAGAGPVTTVELRTELLETRVEVGAPPADAYAALHQAYAALRIPAPFRDDASMTLANDRLTLMRSFAGEPLSVFFTCGRTQGYTGDVADFYRLRVSIRSGIASAPGGSAVTTAVEATAHNPERSGREGMNCRSTGMLERLIAAEVENRVGA